VFLGIAVVDSNEFSTVYIFSQQTVMVIVFNTTINNMSAISGTPRLRRD
jgi:hypothetical protein